MQDDQISDYQLRPTSSETSRNNHLQKDRLKYKYYRLEPQYIELHGKEKKGVSRRLARQDQ